MKKHIFVLIILTVLIRGIMFISYPMGGFDDDQSAIRYQINEILNGNLLVGNMRYHTGYSFFIAPVAGVAQLFGSFDERFWLLVQIGLSSLIPFMIYDILRTRRSPREAFVVALVVLLDPFGMQWAHFALPNWMIAFCFVLAFWLIHRGLLRPQRLLVWVAVAGIFLGLASLARLNMAPAVAVVGVMFFALRRESLRRRFLMFTTLGVSSVAVLALYILFIHYPSTGTFNLSCYGGTNLLVSIYKKDFSITASNGPATEHLLNLLTLEPLQPLSFTSETYPRWSEPGSWATPEDRAAFLSQPYGTPPEQLPYVWPPTLFYYLGPCETDDLLGDVYAEAVQTQPLQFMGSIPPDVFNMLVQRPLLDITFHPWYLSRVEQLTLGDAGPLGFYRVESDFYNGHWAWIPGITLFSSIYDVWNLVKWLTPLALVWALFSRSWFYGSAAVLLLAFLVSIAIFGNPVPRHYSPLYPLWPLLIGGMLAAMLRAIERWRSRQDSSASAGAPPESRRR